VESRCASVLNEEMDWPSLLAQWLQYVNVLNIDRLIGSYEQVLVGCHF
jgi:hypothetical protein